MRFMIYGAKNMAMRIFPLMLCISILCALFTLPAAVSSASSQEDLVDIKAHWAETVIRKWVSQGLAKGYGDGRFGPNDSITRAEFVTLLNRIFGYKKASEKTFPDVKAGAWYAGEIAKAYQAGIISGDNKGNMNPEAVISRQEAVVILTRAFSLTGDYLDAALKYVDLNQIADWALGSVGIMTKKGYVTGRPGNVFAPKDNLSRAEAVKMIDNVMGELINVAGTFTRVVPGNMVVSTSGVTLKDTYIAGDLYLTEGIGSSTIQLIDVEIKGRTIAADGIDVKNLLIGTNTELGNTQGQATPKPTGKPSTQPTSVPGSTTPTTAPGSSTPSTPGTETQPTTVPTPTQGPTAVPTQSPTATPTQSPTTAPTPTQGPTITPTQSPTTAPTPTQGPTITPTQGPTTTPTPGTGYKLTVNAVNGFVTVNPEKDVYAPGEIVELFTRPEPGYSFRAWSGDLSGQRLRETIVMDGIKSVTAAFDTWLPPIGIPEPPFGIFETYRMYDDTAKRNPELTYHQNTEGGCYTHYVDNSKSNATDSNNPYGTAEKPRRTLPKAADVPPGSVIEFHGGPYTLDYTIYRVDGTEDMPIFIRGYSQTDRVELNGGDFYLNSSWLILENITRLDDGTCVRSFKDRQAHHVCVRNCDTAGLSALSWDGGSSENIVFYGNYNNSNSFDPNAGNFKEKDGGGIGLNLGSNGVWIVDNHITRAGGDASGGGHAANYTAKNYYIGRNIMHTCGENAIDIKEVDTAIVSQNIMYDFQGWSSGSDGTAIVAHYGPKYSPKNVWLLYNEIFDCSDKGIQVGGDQAYPVYIIGNVIHDIHNDNGTGKAFTTWNCREVYLSNNVIYNTDNGVDWGVTVNAAQIFFRNNIVSNISGTGYALRVEDTNQMNKAEIGANLFWQPGGSAKIRWGSNTYNVNQFMQATGKGAGSLEADPMFVSPQKGDFRLRPGSPAIDSGQDDEIYELFKNKYGIDIRIDSVGATRPQGGKWDMGAYEYTGGSITPTQTPSPTPTPTHAPTPTPLDEDLSSWKPPVGIPDPGFGIRETRPARPEPWTEPVTGYYYVNQETGSDKNNPYGTPSEPRKSIPRPIPAGSYVEIHGKYSSYPIWIQGEGTADEWVAGVKGPVWVVGDEADRPEFGHQTVVYGSYVYVESINFRPQGSGIGRLQIGSSGSVCPADHIVVRYCDLEGPGTGGATASAIIGRSDGPVSNVVVFRNSMSKYGDMAATTDQDNAPLIVDQYSSYIWVLENTMHTCTAGFRAGAQGKEALSRFVYAGRNRVYNTFQAGMAVKRAEDVVFSENIIHDIIDTSWSPSKGIGFQYQPTRFWIINNTIFNCHNGIRSGSDDTTEETPVYIIGNTIYNAKIEGTSSYGATEGIGIQMNGSKSTRYVVGNTIYDTDVAISNEYYEARLVISNNIIQNSRVMDIRMKGSGSGASSRMYNNLFGSPVRIRWTGDAVHDLASFQQTYDTGVNCIVGDAMFVDAIDHDFRLKPESPARDRGSEETIYQLFQDLYGIDIRVSANGITRPQGSGWDMGAYEYQE